MSKLIAPISKIRDLARRAFPNGIQEIGVPEVHLMLSRIAELERALEPFARSGNLPSDSELVPVYHRDCKAATQMLTSEVAPVVYEYPA